MSSARRNPQKAAKGREPMKKLLLRPSLVCLVDLLFSTPGFAAVPTVDGSSAPLWKPCTAWVQKLPAKYEVVNQSGELRFRVEGGGSEMPWIMDLKDMGLTGDERYLLVRYKAAGMSTRPGVYFLHGEEGTHGGRAANRRGLAQSIVATVVDLHGYPIGRWPGL
jgi:hypothetical protein